MKTLIGISAHYVSTNFSGKPLVLQWEEWNGRNCKDGVRMMSF